MVTLLSSLVSAASIVVAVRADDTCVQSSSSGAFALALLQIKSENSELLPSHQADNVEDSQPRLPALVSPELDCRGNSCRPKLGYLQSFDGKCLKFLHIPKNGGTTIERFILNRSLASFGFYDRSMKCNNGTRRGMGCQFADRRGTLRNCSVWHVPPIYDAGLAAFYRPCETFCVTRHPLLRAWSQHFYSTEDCSAKAFAENMKSKLLELESNPFVEDCHWVKQSTYVDGGAHCQHVLRAEHLEEDFNGLMAQFSIPIALEQKNHISRSGCDIKSHIKNIPRETLEFIEWYYAEDYKAFGYNKTSQSMLEISSYH